MQVGSNEEKITNRIDLPTWDGVPGNVDRSNGKSTLEYYQYLGSTDRHNRYDPPTNDGDSFP